MVILPGRHDFSHEVRGGCRRHCEQREASRGTSLRSPKGCGNPVSPLWENHWIASRHPPRRCLAVAAKGVADETTSHSTRRANYAHQVAGYRNDGLDCFALYIL